MYCRHGSVYENDFHTGKLSVKHKQEKSNVYIIGSLSNDDDRAEEEA